MAYSDKRYTIYPDPSVLAVLGIDLGEGSAPQTHAALQAWADAVESAAGRLDLSRGEWNYLADALNGCFDLWQETAVRGATLLWAEADDAHRLNRLGDKWLDEAGGKAADKAAASLVGKLRGMDEASAWAVLAAVRHFWRHHETIDIEADEWWTPAFRRGELADRPVVRRGRGRPRKGA